MIRAGSITITQEMLSLIAEIDEFKGAWRALGKIAPDRLRQLRKIATIESVGSSTRIEGAKLTDREVEKLLGRIKARTFATRDEQEVAGYAAAMDTVYSNYSAIPITENYIKQLHAMLLKYSRKDARHRGEYKKLSNNVVAFSASGKPVGVVFETSTPFNTPRDMEQLVAWYSKVTKEKSLHPLIIAAIFVVVFLAIHPFQDGNGRLSRVLTTLLLLKCGYAYVPYSSLESIIEQNKDGYYLALRRTQGTLKKKAPNWSPWLSFFLHSLQKQKSKLEAKVEREKIMRTTLPELAIDILDLAAEHGQISIADIIRVTKAPRATIKKRLTDLTNSRHLKRGGKGRSTWYSLE
ncbi:MAG: Fic family protein [Planctomycetes bacterium]|nr:Fic family protein [Planctomycetota bacterium]